MALRNLSHERNRKMAKNGTSRRSLWQRHRMPVRESVAKWLLQKISFSWSCVFGQERGRISEADKEVILAGFCKIIKISYLYHCVLREGRSADV